MKSATAGDDFNGSFTNVRGDILVDAGAIGAIPLVCNQAQLNEPCEVDPYRGTLMARGGPVLLPGDGATTLRTHGDLVFGGLYNGFYTFQRDTVTSTLHAGDAQPTGAGVARHRLGATGGGLPRPKGRQASSDLRK